MKLSCHAAGFLDVADEVLALFCCQGDQPTGDTLEKIDILTDGDLGEMFKSGEFNGSSGTDIMLRRVPEMAAKRVILAGLGDKDKIGPDAYRQAAGRVGKMIMRHKAKSVSFYYDGPDVASVAAAVVEGLVLGSYRFLQYKTDKDKEKDKIESLSFAVPRRGRLRQAEAGVLQGDIISSAVVQGRDLAGMPGNDLYPESFAGIAQDLAKKHRFKCRVLGPADIKKQRMGALEAVGKGSDRKPHFVVLEYHGHPKDKPIVLVGKGITFDSGGISLKPGLGMDEMKGDMSGAAVMMMVLATVARLGAKVNLVALLPLAENMPSGGASRPGDIITSRAGQTIEIISTDAEGRLILADALDYADTFNPQAVIDIATLTGAALYILGYAGAPFVGTSQKLNDGLRAAAERTGEKIWELPLWNEFAEQMKSPVADLKNSGGKASGTLAASSFLKKFVKDWPWAHIDIAYCDVEPNGKPYVPKGPTGFGIRLLVDLLCHWRKL